MTNWQREYYAEQYRVTEAKGLLREAVARAEAAEQQLAEARELVLGLKGNLDDPIRFALVDQLAAVLKGATDAKD